MSGTSSGPCRCHRPVVPVVLIILIAVPRCHWPILSSSFITWQSWVATSWCSIPQNLFKFVETLTPRDLVDVERSRISPLFLPPLSSLTCLNLDLEKAKQTQLKDTSKNMSWAFGMFLCFVTNNFLDFFRFYWLGRQQKPVTNKRAKTQTTWFGPRSLPLSPINGGDRCWLETQIAWNIFFFLISH